MLIINAACMRITMQDEAEKHYLKLGWSKNNVLQN